MALQSDHKALVFIGMVAVLGAGVRVVRAAGNRPDLGAQPALARQAQSADSSAHAGRGRGSAARGGPGRAGTGTGGRGRSSTTAANDSTRQQPRDSTRRRREVGPLDRRGYVFGKLDLDVATAAQIDSLPGVSTTMARRIVLDRMTRGPFVTRDGLRRVTGVGPLFLKQIDTLITFSGTVTQPSASDTVIGRARQARVRRPTRPAARRTAEPRRAPLLRAVADNYSRHPV